MKQRGQSIMEEDVIQNLHLLTFMYIRLIDLKSLYKPCMISKILEGYNRRRLPGQYNCREWLMHPGCREPDRSRSAADNQMLFQYLVD